MPHLGEDQALVQVSERLAALFPDLSVETVNLAVRDVHRTFDGRVRDYVPVLVERAARERLAALASSAADPGAGSTYPRSPSGAAASA